MFRSPVTTWSRPGGVLAVTRSLNSEAGKGLAGFLSSLLCDRGEPMLLLWHARMCRVKSRCHPAILDRRRCSWCALARESTTSSPLVAYVVGGLGGSVGAGKYEFIDYELVVAKLSRCCLLSRCPRCLAGSQRLYATSP
jgi:hypothetical protein